ncbi:HEAT repeat domain-containing protein [Allorhizobium taibaishanense]|uniref:Uncharacterized protein n=1 Tax=Allorhizobium taibaishanense TaxID=887144 RepID=A0A7W6HKQ5_9HYPH|nr:HEAT repeat domain-containing protein [Allorhizobium taibaishanense]MBB4007015.1 hypothetical protein [Allorhizobium taibaishanense]
MDDQTSTKYHFASSSTLLAILDDVESSYDFQKTQKVVKAALRYDPSWWSESFNTQWVKQHERQLNACQALSQIFLFHDDGFLRQMALERLASPLNHPFVAYGLGLRLNDWVPEIRRVAKITFDRCYASTPPEIWEEALWHLLPRSTEWRRWFMQQKHEEVLYSAAANRQEQLQGLVSRLAASRSSGSTTMFRLLARSPNFDRFLPDLALGACQPHVRTLALVSIMEREARWSTGKFERVWHDKVFGRYQDKEIWRTRPLTLDVDIVPILTASLHDRSSLVRRRALDLLTRRRDEDELKPLVQKTLVDLANDPNPAVQGRLDFLRRSQQPGFKI